MFVRFLIPTGFLRPSMVLVKKKKLILISASISFAIISQNWLRPVFFPSPELTGNR
jgi:hypothetical protein